MIALAILSGLALGLPAAGLIFALLGPPALGPAEARALRAAARGELK